MDESTVDIPPGYEEADIQYQYFHTNFLHYLEQVKDFEKDSEGSSIQEQIEYDYDLLTLYPKIQRIFEIGMNMGISTAAFLSVRPDIHVTSVDICTHDYVEKCKAVLDQQFPGRHILHKGDSTIVVPQLPPAKYDLIFVDGNHEAPYPLLDMENVLPFCHEETFIILDDMCDAYGRNGIYQAVDQLIEDKKITLIEHIHAQNRGWGVFRKVFT